MQHESQIPAASRIIKPHNGHFRICLTGGPGGGKTTAADLFRRELGEKVVVVPEAATLLFSGGFPRDARLDSQKALQRAIFHVQRNIEDIQIARYSDRILLCDRGTVDGAAYWPGGEEDFFKTVGSNLQTEFDRYDAVVYFESAAIGGIGIEGGNPTRIESLEQARQLCLRLREVWKKHPHFAFIPHNVSFVDKILQGLNAIKDFVSRFQLKK